MKKIRSTSQITRKSRFFRLTEEERELPASKRPPDASDVLMHPRKRGLQRKYIRISSLQRMPSEVKYYEEIRPLNELDVVKIKELELQVKLCDMGNACYRDKHYSDIIQTREYRSPEVILGGDYDETADLWSLACMVFELVTGDYLFDPRKGNTYRKNDDHLALITELIGPCYNRNFMESHPKIWKFYNKKNMRLKNISKLKKWPLYNVLLEKYRLKDKEAETLSSFLSCMLQWRPKDRMSARDLLQHPWFKETDDYGVWMNKEHLKEFKIVNNKSFPGYLTKLRAEKAAREEVEKKRQEGESVSSARSFKSEKGFDHYDADGLDKRDMDNIEIEKALKEEGIQKDVESSGSESTPYESGRSSDENSGEEDSSGEEQEDENEDDDEEAKDEDDDWEDEDV